MLNRLSLATSKKYSSFVRSFSSWHTQPSAVDYSYMHPQVKIFNSHIESVARFDPTATDEDILNEPSIGSASADFMRVNGGELTRMIFDSLPTTYYHSGFHQIFDVRVHRFPASLISTKGLTLWPATPGLHCDADYRLNYFSQPDLNKAPLCEHYAAMIASDCGISNTRFALGHFRVNVGAANKYKTVWQQVDEQIYSEKNLNLCSMKEGELTRFNSESLHEAMPVQLPGSRLFFRAINYYRPGLGHGYISRHDQLYTLFKLPDNLTTFGDSVVLDTQPACQLVNKVRAHYSIKELADETLFLNADINHARKQGGPVLRELIKKLPTPFQSFAKIDFLIYRLNNGETPDIPGYDQLIRFPGWHLPLALDDLSSAKLSPEIIASVSTHPDVVNQTVLQGSPLTVTVVQHSNPYHFWGKVNQVVQSAISNQTKVISDGEMVLTNNKTLRCERPAVNRGWRGFFRARMDYPKQFINEQQHLKKTKETHTSDEVQQLYVSVPSRNKGY